MSGARVLVLDADERQALAACRALGRSGYEVGVAGSRETSLAGLSRYSARHHRLPDPRTPTAEAYAERLADAVARFGYQVLLPCLDETFARVERIALNARVAPDPGPGRDRLVDKLHLVELGRAADVPYPRTRLVSDGLAAADRESLSPPIVCKARRSAVAHETRVAHHSGAAIAWTWEEAELFSHRLRERGLEPIVQERIERAEKINATIVRREGRSEVRFPYRVLRDLPLTGGIAVTTQTLGADSGAGREAIDALERLCDAAGYEGVANGEFARSREDGRLYLIEVNPRLWGSLWFAERLGQRVVERVVRAALEGEPLPAADPPAPMRQYHFATSELRWAFEHPRPARPLVELLSSLRPGDVFEYADATDALVVLRYPAEKLRRRLRRS